MNAPRILIVRTDRIGDVILSTPVIRTLRAAFPDAYLGMMVRPEHRQLVEGNPDLNVVILYDKAGPEKNWLGSLQFAQKLKVHRFDTALILHSTRRVILVSWLAGIRQRVGYARRLPWLLTKRLPYVKKEGQRHELEYNLDLLRLVGMDPSGSGSSKELFVPVTPEQTSKVESFFRTQRLDLERPIVALHPGASCPSKKWNPERFAAVADRLVERYQAQILVVTGPDGVADGKKLLARMKHPAHPALGFFSLGETASLFQKVRCLISNDSGPVHLACAVGTPVITIFGRWGPGLSPTRWGPTGERSISLHKDVGCRPCLAHRCPIGFVCLDAISVEEVLAAVERVMDRNEKLEVRSQKVAVQ